jgi:curved DNA-binding protein CbpA
MAATYYEILGVPKEASVDEIRHAWLAKSGQLASERHEGASDHVGRSLSTARSILDQAWAILGDPARRADYDAELARADGRPSDRRQHAERIWAMEHDLGMPMTPALGYVPPTEVGGGAQPDRSTVTRRPEAGMARRREPISRPGLVSPIFAALQDLADWIGPHPTLSRTVRVPDVQAMAVQDAYYEVARVDLHIHFVRLNDPGTGGGGVVVDQSPGPGTRVRRHSILTVQVVYPEEGRIKV